MKTLASNISVMNTTRGTIPTVPLIALKDRVLGKRYELSLVFIGDKRSQTLNKAHKHKDKPASVLSFPLEHDIGEMFINLPLAKRRAKKFGMTYTQLVTYLFIHGLLHLKGLDHGSTMDRSEKKLCREFSVPFYE